MTLGEAVEVGELQSIHAQRVDGQWQGYALVTLADWRGMFAPPGRQTVLDLTVWRLVAEQRAD